MPFPAMFECQKYFVYLPCDLDQILHWMGSFLAHVTPFHQVSIIRPVVFLLMLLRKRQKKNITSLEEVKSTDCFCHWQTEKPTATAFVESGKVRIMKSLQSVCIYLRSQQQTCCSKCHYNVWKWLTNWQNKYISFWQMNVWPQAFTKNQALMLKLVVTTSFLDSLLCVCACKQMWIIYSDDSDSIWRITWTTSNVFEVGFSNSLHYSASQPLLGLALLWVRECVVFVFVCSHLNRSLN